MTIIKTENSRSTTAFLFSCLWWRNPLGHMWFVSHKFICIPHCWDHTISRENVKIVCPQQAAWRCLSNHVQRIGFWNADLSILWMPKHRAIDNRMTDLSWFVKRKMICSSRDIRAKIQRWRLWGNVSDEMSYSVLFCLTCCCPHCRWRERKKLKKEKEEAGVWALTVGGFSIMYVGRRALHLPADLTAVPSVLPLTLGFDP